MGAHSGATLRELAVGLTSVAALLAQEVWVLVVAHEHRDVAAAAGAAIRACTRQRVWQLFLYLLMWSTLLTNHTCQEKREKHQRI